MSVLRTVPGLGLLALSLATCLAFPALAQAAPTELDLRDRYEAYPSAKNQGQCGDDYLVAPVSAAEWSVVAYADTIGYQPLPVALSAQALLDCGTGYYGDFACDGGFPRDAFEFLRVSGTTLESEYPYVASPGTCQAYEPRVWVQAADHQPTPIVNDVKEAIAIGQAVVVSMDVYDDFYSYSSGIYRHITGAYAGGHAVVAIGWGNEAGVPYWIMQNTWGPGWGEGGFFRIAMDDVSLSGWWAYYHGGLAPTWIQADAGPDETVYSGAFVSLDGSASVGDVGLSYTWTQESGSAVVLDTSDPAHPTFVAPEEPQTLTFALEVSDGIFTTYADVVDIVVAEPPPIEPGTYQLESDYSGLCLEVAGASLNNGANIQQGPCTSSAHQMWRLILKKDGSYRIRNGGSDKCMRAVGSSDGDNVQQGRCLYKRSKWVATRTKGESVELRSVKTGDCAEVADTETGANLHHAECSGLADQSFTLVAAAGP